MIEIIKHGKYFNQYHCNCDVCGCEWIGGLIDKCKSDVCSCPECGHTTLEMYTKMMSKGLKNKDDDEWISVKDRLPNEDDVVVVTNNELSYKDRYADVYTAIYKYNNWYDWCGNDIERTMISGPVTHWRKAIKLPYIDETVGG